MEDAADLKSAVETRVGSNPTRGTSFIIERAMINAGSHICIRR